MKPRLKSLELHGYKTFAGKVLFEFPGNVTAIVGPNGSGKSNIADALRWVLGEQSYSLLRGKKTEDMIFLGSDQRPRAGMASATIMFDNEDDWLPIDYSEVGIARRAYRDGSNEYLLNKQRVRLKDISELLAQSGLAERTYTIIGQGLVDAALSLRPEERRRFFEEAAGIGLFRSRREEALSRLDVTRRNLERVNDILSELEPRLRSLERQAKRMEEYDRVKSDLQVLLKDWYGFHWQNTQKELLRNKEVLKNQEEKVNSARGKRTEIEKQVDAARNRLQELRGMLNQWHMESAGLHTQREKLSRNIAVLEERVRSYIDQQTNLAAELTRNEEQARVNAEKLESLLSDKELLDAEMEENQQQLKSVQEAFSARQEERSRLENTLHLERRKLVETETKQVQLKAHLRELTGRIETQNSSRASLLDGIEKAKREIQGSNAELEKLNATRKKAESRAGEIENEITSMAKKISEAEEELKQKNVDIGKIEADLARNQAQLEVLEQAERAFSGMGEGAKSLLTAVRSGKLKGQMQSISQLLDVPAEYEVAISSVLGEQLDAVMYGDDVDAESILQFLEVDESGRAVLIPSARTVQTEKIKSIKSPDVLGLASDLVRGMDGNKRLIEFLLGQVILVKDRSAARKLLGDIPPVGKIVTLKGEVFNSNGVIIAGKERRSGIISRPRQKKDLQDTVSALMEKKNRAVEELERTSRQLHEYQEKKKQLDGSLKEQQTVLNSSRAAVDTALRNLTQLTQKLEWQNGQIETLQRQLGLAEEEINTTQQEVEKGAALIGAVNNTLRETNEQLRAVPIDDLQTQLVHWNTTLAVNERAVKEIERRQTEYEQTVLQNKSVITQVVQRFDDLKNLVLEVEQEKEKSKLEEEQINQQIALAQEKIDPAEKELNTLENDYSRLQHEYSLTQQFEANADRVYSQAQLEMARSRESLDNLRRKIEDDFGLVALEYSEDITGPTPLPLEGVNQLVTLTEIPKELEDSINRQRALLRRMGAINPDAQKEYQEVKERHEFLTSQLTDLQKADNDLRQIITELDELMHRQFRATFNAVAAEFKVMFSRLFGGGTAKLVMTDDENPTETGIDIEAKLPGRREQGLSLLSGGERSLTAVALIFSLLKVSPTPFCVLDEVDAALDEANVGRFTELLKELAQETQFIVITHNRNTVQVADVIYGVTMGRDSASQVISMKLDEIGEDMAR